MTKLSHWIKACRGTLHGIVQFDFEKTHQEFSHDERRVIFEAQEAIKDSVISLYNFNTRDYAYDRGGMAIDDIEMGDYDKCQWINPDLL